MRIQLDDGALWSAARRVALPGWASICLALAIACPAVAGSICTDPTCVNSGDLSLRLNNSTTNDLGFQPGLEIILSADSVVPNGSGSASPPTMATAQTIDPTNGQVVTMAFPFLPSTVVPNQFSLETSNVNLTNPWTVTFTNSGTTPSTLVETSPSLTGVTPAPFANNVTISGTSLDPTFTWSYPSIINGVTVLVYDKSIITSAGIPDLIYASRGLPGSTNTYTIPSNVLTPGSQYDVVLKAQILRNTSLPLINPNIFTQSDSYFPFTPVSSAVSLYLPTVNPATRTYTYNMTVAAGTKYFVDPLIAVGYAYQIGTGNPDFASVQLPSIQTDDFDLSYLENGSWRTATVAPGGTFDFPDGGVTSFDVTGIDPSLMLDPGDTTAFVTGLTFTADGSFTGTQTPITSGSAVPEPSTWAMMLLGVAGLGFSGFRRASSRGVTARAAV
jgi:PEP-CTERM motif